VRLDPGLLGVAVPPAEVSLHHAGVPRQEAVQGRFLPAVARAVLALRAEGLAVVPAVHEAIAEQLRAAEQAAGPDVDSGVAVVVEEGRVLARLSNLIILRTSFCSTAAGAAHVKAGEVAVVEGAAVVGLEPCVALAADPVAAVRGAVVRVRAALRE